MGHDSFYISETVGPRGFGDCIGSPQELGSGPNSPKYMSYHLPCLDRPLPTQQGASPSEQFAIQRDLTPQGQLATLGYGPQTGGYALV